MNGLRQVAGTLKTVPVVEAVNIPFVARFLGEDGTLHPDDVMDAAADVMLAEPARLTGALRPLRLG